MSESIYQVEGLKQCYDDRTVLDLERLDIMRGEVLALVGPSGAGKSTLLRLLNFLERPTSGSISFAGHPLNGGIPLDLRRQVTTVFQRPVLLHASVRENVAYGLRLRGQSVDSQVEAMLERVGLAGMARSAAHTLSGGEMQRVALARALVIGPQVLLLDEHTANLDPYNVGLIEDIVRQHNRQHGTTVVLVTHNVFQAKRLAHRVGLLLAGKLVELEDTHTFFESPRDLRTLAFVNGEMVY
jgi:tungstate transport system ATP-binding protein